MKFFYVTSNVTILLVIEVLFYQKIKLQSVYKAEADLYQVNPVEQLIKKNLKILDMRFYLCVSPKYFRNSTFQLSKLVY